jgi:hypothetical protein
LFFVDILKVNAKIAGSGSGSISQKHGSADPDPAPSLKCHGSATLGNTLLDYTPYLGHSSGELAGHVGEGGCDHQRVTHSVHYPDPKYVC